MNNRPKPPRVHSVPVTQEIEDDEVVNDSLGTINPADSTGIDEDKETGEARDQNFPTRED